MTWEDDPVANRKKIEMRVQVLEEEIQELEREIKVVGEQKLVWQGYSKAAGEVLEMVGELYRQIQKAMQWNKLTDEEREKGRDEKSTLVPPIEMEDQAGEVAAKLLRPLQMLVGNMRSQGQVEPGRFEAQCLALGKQVERLKKKIEYEMAKDCPDFAGDQADTETQPEG